VYAGGVDGKIYAFAVGCRSDGGSCTPLWTGATGAPIASSPAVANGVVYVGSNDGKLYAFAVGCAGGGGPCSPLWTGAVGDTSESSPAVANGVVYMGSSDGKLYAFAVGCASSGGACDPIWTGTTGGRIDSSPAVANGVVYIGSMDGKLYAFAVGCASGELTCTPLWARATGGHINSSPVVAQGRVYVGSWDGKLYAFGLAHGSVDHLVLSPSSASISAGVSQAYTAEGFDSHGNSLGDVTGSTTFTIDSGTACPSQTCSSTLAGDHIVTGTDGTATGSSTLHVNAGSATHLTVAGLTTPRTAGVAGTITVTAKDAYNNTVTGYTGTVHFSSSDAAAALPANSTLTAGVRSFSVTLKTAGIRRVTATDAVTASITGSQTGIVVRPSVSFVSVPRPARRGSVAHLSVRTSVGATCSIVLILPSGAKSDASGLKTTPVAGTSGLVAWDWNVAATTIPGTARATVTCILTGASGAATATFTVG
jgi:hypothetical protein